MQRNYFLQLLPLLLLLLLLLLFSFVTNIPGGAAPTNVECLLGLPVVLLTREGESSALALLLSGAVTTTRGSSRDSPPPIVSQEEEMLWLKTLEFCKVGENKSI